MKTQYISFVAPLLAGLIILSTLLSALGKRWEESRSESMGEKSVHYSRSFFASFIITLLWPMVFFWFFFSFAPLVATPLPVVFTVLALMALFVGGMFFLMRRLSTRIQYDETGFSVSGLEGTIRYSYRDIEGFENYTMPKGGQGLRLAIRNAKSISMDAGYVGAKRFAEYARSRMNSQSAASLGLGNAGTTEVLGRRYYLDPTTDPRFQRNYPAPPDGSAEESWQQRNTTQSSPDTAQQSWNQRNRNEGERTGAEDWRRRNNPGRKR